MGDVTVLIERARDGDAAAFDRIFALLYPDLRQVAHRRLSRHARDGAIETTALVHECYLKLLHRGSLTPGDRAHFLGYAAAVMRSVIVDAARQSQAARRGGGAAHVPLDTDLVETLPDAATEILDVHAALDDLARIDERLARVVEMRWFGGMTDGEIASALDLNERTVRRDWDKARLLLAHALRG